MKILDKKIKYFFIFLLFIFSSFSKSIEFETANPEQEGFSKERLERIAPAMEKYINANLTPGVLTAIMRNGKIIHFETQGYMDVEAKKPMRDDAIFRIASMTKPVASIALMILWEEGLFQLNDPVSKYIPSLRFESQPKFRIKKTKRS